MQVPLFKNLFNSNEKEINSLRPLISEINSLEEKTKKLRDGDFSEKTAELKKRLSDGAGLDAILPEAFAYVKEAARRAIGLRHFDVQLTAAISLAHGKIAEQKTGEGKTLSAVPALYINSLTGHNVHLVTVNDYLARRDAGWMGPVFHLLGVSVASIISEQSFIFDPDFVDEQAADLRLRHLRPATRKEAYLADVVYGINSEFGFDYLRDNMARDKESIVQRGHFYAVVDEVDSVLIDEARTPHIISAPDEKPTEKYYEYAKAVEKLNPETDFKIDEKLRTAHLTEEGIEKIEKLYGIENIYEKDFDTIYHLEAALKAKTLFHKEKDYIVRENEVILVDEFTGRLMVGRRLSEGLHQAIEAKEKVTIQRESKTLATVSLQNYFRMYEKLAGMTGTAVTEAEEFHKIYKLDVVVIPTNRAVNRIDQTDAVYKTQKAKYSAVVEEIAKIHRSGQPVLVGTTAIDKNELLSELLRKKGIRHEVLNAKNHLREAEIIARAGKKGAVTVATNMAGRGVDIILGGESPKNEDGTDKRGTSAWEAWEDAHKEVVKLGGLAVIGTERHESRRIDNQLRGRSGRQGDPGTSRFFVSLDDEIMRLFGGEMIANLMTRFNMPENIPLAHPLVSRAIEQAQRKVEGFNFDTRKHLVEYDDVLNKQREIIYAMRRKIVLGESSDQSLKENILAKVRKSIRIYIDMHSQDIYAAENSTTEKILQEFVTIIPFDQKAVEQLYKQLEQIPENSEKEEFLYKIAADLYDGRQKQLGEQITRQIERFVVLSVIDNLWVDHLDVVENLRQGIGLRGYGQRDPLVEYKNEAFHMFEQLISAIDDEIVHRIYKVQVQATPISPLNTANQITNAPESEVSQQSVVGRSSSVVGRQPLVARNSAMSIGSSQSGNNKKKIGRNDPCPCGSGKKYKNCHYPN